jgi:hypothetical protein
MFFFVKRRRESAAQAHMAILWSFRHEQWVQFQLRIPYRELGSLSDISNCPP